MNRREFIDLVRGGIFFSLFGSFLGSQRAMGSPLNDIFSVKSIPNNPFYSTPATNYHAGIDSLIYLMGNKGLKFYRSAQKTTLSGPSGLIGPEDVVLIKVNAQWKYRGCTNSDLIQGIIQRILDHPDVFTGEVVIFENGQGRGSLSCDTYSHYQNDEVHANANDESHNFLYLVNTVFNDPRVSSFLLDPVRSNFIEEDDHVTDGYRLYENVSYPCFTTAGGKRVELNKGIWKGNNYSQNLKLINVPVLKDHAGSEITACLKHMYGVVSMEDGQSGYRHYTGLGETCGKMMVSVCAPVLNIIDAIWVSHTGWAGYPASTTFRANQIMASQDPVALDYWAARYILYPFDSNIRHHPDFKSFSQWLQDAQNTINNRGGLKDTSKGILVDQVTKKEEEMQVYLRVAKLLSISGIVTMGESRTDMIQGKGVDGVVMKGLPGSPNADNSGKYSAKVVYGWGGKVIPQKDGFTFLPQNRNYSNVISNQVSQDYTALQVQYALTIGASTGGTTHPPPGTYTYDPGTKVTVEAVAERGNRFSSWSGDLSGTINPITVTIDSNKSIIANFKRIIYAPLNFEGRKVLNRSLTQAEYINILTWQANTDNVNIMKYRIYQVKEANRFLLVEMTAGTFKYMHRKIKEGNPYTYALVAVNNEGIEGETAYLSIQ